VLLSGLRIEEEIMDQFTRREAIRVLGATAVATTLSSAGVRAAPEYHVVPEKAANLKILRWKSFVQSDDDQWLANTRKFTEETGIQAVIENVNVSDITSKAHGGQCRSRP
jgi:multiple sugar transport system substrate-binding protein